MTCPEDELQSFCIDNRAWEDFENSDKSKYSDIEFFSNYSIFAQIYVYLTLIIETQSTNKCCRLLPKLESIYFWNRNLIFLKNQWIKFLSNSLIFAQIYVYLASIIEMQSTNKRRRLLPKFESIYFCNRNSNIPKKHNGSNFSLLPQFFAQIYVYLASIILKHNQLTNAAAYYQNSSPSILGTKILIFLKNQRIEFLSNSSNFAQIYVFIALIIETQSTN